MNIAYRQSQAFFESRYQTAKDPWQFASSAYELVAIMPPSPRSPRLVIGGHMSRAVPLAC
jgi:hypothetical protein